MKAKVEVAEAQAQEASNVKSQLQTLLSQGVLMVDSAGNLKPVNNQDQLQASQSRIPNLQRPDSQASQSSQPSYSSHLRRGTAAKNQGSKNEDKMAD